MQKNHTNFVHKFMHEIREKFVHEFAHEFMHGKGIRARIHI